MQNGVNRTEGVTNSYAVKYMGANRALIQQSIDYAASTGTSSIAWMRSPTGPRNASTPGNATRDEQSGGVLESNCVSRGVLQARSDIYLRFEGLVPE